MIIARAPLRISFAGGASDLPSFYRTETGKVLSATINKYVYVAVNKTPLIEKVSLRYSKSEFVDHPSKLIHKRAKAALLDLGIHNHIEITTFSDVPEKTGLGSSGAFSAALLTALNHALGKKLSPLEIAEAACRLEMDLVGEPIGKQDQYAAAHGGFNVFSFNPDDTVHIKPLSLPPETSSEIEKNLLLFYTGITRSASDILTEQNSRASKNNSLIKELVSMVGPCEKAIYAKDMDYLAKLLNEGWQRKRRLASSISNTTIDQLYAAGVQAGAVGGKILGAGGGGCLLFVAKPKNHTKIRQVITAKAKQCLLHDFSEIPIQFGAEGAQIVLSYLNEKEPYFKPILG